MKQDEVIDSAHMQQMLDEQCPAWGVSDSTIVRTIETTSWKSSLMLANAIGYLAERAWHHPRLVLEYSSVEVMLTTHSAGGLTMQDLELAIKIEELVAWPSKETGVFRQPPEKHALL